MAWAAAAARRAQNLGAHRERTLLYSRKHSVMSYCGKQGCPRKGKGRPARR